MKEIIEQLNNEFHAAVLAGNCEIKTLVKQGDWLTTKLVIDGSTFCVGFRETAPFVCYHTDLLHQHTYSEAIALNMWANYRQSAKCRIQEKIEELQQELTKYENK